MDKELEELRAEIRKVRKEAELSTIYLIGLILICLGVAISFGDIDGQMGFPILLVIMGGSVAAMAAYKLDRLNRKKKQ